MQTNTRKSFNEFLRHIARLNFASSAHETFTVAPAVQQRLETAVQESSDFLRRINIHGVIDQEGEAILLGVNGPTAGRVDSAGGGRRNPAQHGVLSKGSYSCKQTNFDTAIPYQNLDLWAKFPDFQLRLSAAIAQQQALDRIMIGFNGTSAAASTDLGANPLLQDVNVGWLQRIRSEAPQRVLDEGLKVAGKVAVGVGGDYKSIDVMVYDALHMLDHWHRDRNDLVVVTSNGFAHSKLLAVVERGAGSNMEELAADEILKRARLGGLPIVQAPFFPDSAVLVTSLKNLSIYFQEGKRRRRIQDEPDFDRIADYQSSNEAYVIEDFGMAALVENIEFV